MKVLQEQVSGTSNLKSFALLGIAVFSLSWIAIFFRFLEGEIGPFATAFHRVWLAAIILGLWNAIKYFNQKFYAEKSVKKNSYTPLVLLQLLAAGVSLVGHLLLLAWSLSQISIANTCLLANITPIWTVVLGWLIWGKKFDNLFLIGMGIAIAGVSVIGIEDWQLATGNLKADGVAIVASIFYATYLLSIEALRPHFNFVTILSWISTISTLLILPIALIAENQLFPHSWSGWTFVILLGLICQLLGQGLVTYCLKRMSSGLMAVSKLLVPIVTTFLAWVLFAEVLSFWNYVAFFMVLLGIYIAQSSPFAIKE